MYDTNHKLVHCDTLSETRIYAENWCTVDYTCADFDSTDKRAVTIQRRAPDFVENPTAQEDVVVDVDSKPYYNRVSPSARSASHNYLHRLILFSKI